MPNQPEPYAHVNSGPRSHALLQRGNHVSAEKRLLENRIHNRHCDRDGRIDTAIEWVEDFPCFLHLLRTECGKRPYGRAHHLGDQCKTNADETLSRICGKSNPLERPISCVQEKRKCGQDHKLMDEIGL